MPMELAAYVNRSSAVPRFAARSSMGLGSLPDGAPVEVEAIVELKD